MAPRSASDQNPVDLVTSDQGRLMNIVISGAGPAGLLTAIHLLRHNVETGPEAVKYNVTLVDNNADYGALTNDQLKQNHRSWMIGLSDPGIKALREVPSLFEQYVQPVSVALEQFSIRVGKHQLMSVARADLPGENFVVDRNFVVAAMARYLKDHFGKSPYFALMTNTKALFVDVECQRILIRHVDAEKQSPVDTSTDQFLSYDFIVGCDGVRSAVRDGIAKNHRDFEFSISDTFTYFKSVHIERPPSLKVGEMPILTNPLPNMGYGIGLPETGNTLNLATGYCKNAECPEEMKSSDPKVVAKFMKDNFRPFDLVDYDDFAQQWVNQPWSTTGQVHCNFYHSCKHKIILLGDAAHATSPMIGMGMNTALEDAGVFKRLLEDCKHNWMEILPKFSEERVKIGNALSDISMYANSFSPVQAAMLQITGAIRDQLSLLTGGWIMGDPVHRTGMGNYSLADAYNDLVKMNRIQPVREHNDKMRREYFEKSVGMVKD
jgi:kynurenine 3-monooxygenase